MFSNNKCTKGTSTVRKPCLYAVLLVFLLTFLPHSNAIVNITFEVNKLVSLSDTVSLLLTSTNDGQWKKYGSSVTASSDGTTIIGLQGEIEAIQFDASLGLRWSLFGKKNKLDDVVRNTISVEFDVKFDLSAERTYIQLTGQSVVLNKDQTVEFYYKPHYMSFIQRIKNANRGSFTVIDHVVYGYIIRDPKGNVIVDTTGQNRIPTETLVTPAPTKPIVNETPTPAPTPTQPPDINLSGKSKYDARMSSKNQVDTYSYTADISGQHCFYVDADFGMYIRIQNENGKEIKGYWSQRDATVDLESGKTYRLIIEEQNGLCPYVISIGRPHPIVNLTGKTSYYDTFEFMNQQNRYSYIVPVSGLYNFMIQSDEHIYYNVYNKNEKRLAEAWSHRGCPVELAQGDEITIITEHKHKVKDYQLKIGVPQPVRNITNGSVISDTLTYPNQENRYTFTPSQTGDYYLKIDAEDIVRVAIYTQSGKNVLNSSSNWRDIRQLDAGQTYTIVISPSIRYCPYSLQIVRQ